MAKLTHKKVTACKDGKERLIMYYANGDIGYRNMKEGEVFGTFRYLRWCEQDMNNNDAEVLHVKKSTKWLTDEILNYSE